MWGLPCGLVILDGLDREVGPGVGPGAKVTVGVDKTMGVDLDVCLPNLGEVD